MKKRYILIAGANGVGKSTLARIIHDFQTLPGINLDNMVREIGDWRSASAVSKAGKEAVRRIAGFFDNEDSFWQETTLCGRTILRNIQKAHDTGYEIQIHYVGVASTDIAINRIEHRVKSGGHGIPDEDVKRRYKESMNNMKLVLPLCKKAFFYDNTDEATLIALFKDGRIALIKREQPDWFKAHFESFFESTS